MSFFFFQAEDGIRDVAVTGVQTCALPILEQVGLDEDLPVGDRDDVGRNVRRDVPRLRLDDGERRERAAAHLVRELGGALEQPAVEVRSEERRVGKECRSRWSPYH